MTKKIYHLKTCDKCRRMLKEIDTTDYELQEIKTTPITAKQLEELYEITQSYEALFSKRAKKYTQMGLKDKKLTESDIYQLILTDYTFLKRPIKLCGHEVTVGKF